MGGRASLVVQVLDTLEKGNFEVSDRCCIRPACFDLFARRELLFLMLKVLTNIDGLTEVQAGAMVNVASSLSASPLVVGEKTRSSYLEDGVVYERYGIPAMNLETLEETLLGEVVPLIVSARGGYYVRIDGEALRRIRGERGLSIGEVAAHIGISRKAIYKYEHEGRGATLETAIKLEEYLEEPVIAPVDVFFIPQQFQGAVEVKHELERLILERLSEIGFGVYPTSRAPFDAVTKDQEELFFTKISEEALTGLKKRARILKSVSEIAQSGAFFVVARHGIEDSLEGVPVVKREELDEIEETEELVETIEKRKR